VRRGYIENRIRTVKSDEIPEGECGCQLSRTRYTSISFVVKVRSPVNVFLPWPVVSTKEDWKLVLELLFWLLSLYTAISFPLTPNSGP
jgi:hypothetical protein